MKGRKLGHVGNTMLALIFVVLVPIIVPYFLVRTAVARRRFRCDATSFDCLECGDTLGVASVEQADGEWRAYLYRLRNAYPTVPQARGHARQWLRAVCVSCGAR